MSRMTGVGGGLLALSQAGLGLRVAWRLLRTGRDRPIRTVPSGRVDSGAIAVIVPVLNEAGRLPACLERLAAAGAEVGEIVVVDGGSSDGTCAIAEGFAKRDSRVRLVRAGPAPSGWNAKVWGLHSAEITVGPTPRWLLMLDADVHASPALGRSLVARAKGRGVRLLSVATAQRLSGAAEGLLHPALLASLVYRFGRPGTTTRASSEAMANGQCCLIRRDLLAELGGFHVLRESLCEDVTLARLAARDGDAVGFYEADGLVDVSMYASWRDAWQNWPRSLTTRDAFWGTAGWVGLIEVALVQALPLVLLLAGRPSGALRRVNVGLLAMRVGMLVGMARAYPSRPATYWLSPLLDVPVAFALWRSALSRRHVWRGRSYTRQNGLIVAA